MGRRKLNNKGITLRLSEECLKQLDFLCELSGLGRSVLIRELVSSQYDRLHDNEELKDMLSSLKQVNKILGKLDFNIKIK